MVARNNNADLYVSLHINDNSSTSRNGASVYVTSRTELPKYKEGMTTLGNKIIDNLNKLGIAKEGVYNNKLCNDPAPMYHYYDGSRADYYGDIRYAMRGDSLEGLGQDFSDGSGIPTVLIEHCYMNNSHDVQFLDSEADLKKLAKADADAIVDYLQLKLPSEVVSSITTSKSNLKLEVNQKEKISITVAPQTSPDKSVKWVTSNDKIATVDENGNITAVGSGKTKITVSSVINPKANKTIDVVVYPTGAKVEMPKYTVNNKYISKIGEKVALKDFLANIKVSDNLEVAVSIPKKDQMCIGTGTKVNIKEKEHGTILEEYECLLYGDVNGDGKISSLDYTLIKNHIMDVKKIKDEDIKLVSDVNRDNKISSLDYTLIKNHIMNVKKIPLK